MNYSKTEVLDEAIEKLAEGDEDKVRILAEVFNRDQLANEETEMWTPDRPPIVLAEDAGIDHADSYIESLEQRIADWTPDQQTPIRNLEEALVRARRDRQRLIERSNNVGL